MDNKVVERAPWTAADRDAFIAEAVRSTENHGFRCGYKYNVYPKQEFAEDNEDERKVVLTSALSKVLFSPENRIIPLSFYHMLDYKLFSHPMICNIYKRDVVLLLKGSNAYMYLGLADEYPDLFKFSDMDITIYIRPSLPKDQFDNIKRQVEIVIKQTISQYKRILDHFMFLNKFIDNLYFDENIINNFKFDLNKKFEELSDDNTKYYTPFVNEEIRNKSSRHSFLMTNSLVNDNNIVKVDIPHYDRCDRIPLRKTPIYCSLNETLNFKRDSKKDQYVGKFNLFRIKLNAFVTTLVKDDEETTEKEKSFKISLDFIDVSVPDYDDAELKYFWMHKKCINVYDDKVDMWVTIPDLEVCINELDRMLDTYDNPNHKREKRRSKLNAMKTILAFGKSV